MGFRINLNLNTVIKAKRESGIRGERRVKKGWLVPTLAYNSLEFSLFLSTYQVDAHSFFRLLDSDADESSSRQISPRNHCMYHRGLLHFLTHAFAYLWDDFITI